MMKKTISVATTLALVLGGWTGGAARAAPVVASGSGYTVYINGEVSGNALYMANTFDGAAESFARAGETLSVNDTETSLGSGRHRIVIQVDAGGDLFTIPHEAGHTGIGIDGDGFDFASNVYLEDAFIHYYRNGTDVFTSTDLADDYRALFMGAWHGRFADTNVAFSVGNIGGDNINGFGLEFVVSELPASVPEPGSLALAGAALMALAATRRRRA